uniref:GTPase n=1 Tax=Staphylothermus marinus TaxID=2280 RepID=A0A7C4NLP0_STAMA
MFYIVIVGTAGSGKSTLTSALLNYLLDNEVSAIAVNLDPAVEVLPYTPDVDVRDYVSIYELLKEGYGPNAALVESYDRLITRVEELVDEINSVSADCVIIDTPGQMEIFAFRDTGPTIIKSIISDSKSILLFLIDGVQAVDPVNFVSYLFLAGSVHFRLVQPQVNVITKIDLLKKQDIDRISSYLEDPSIVIDELYTSGRDLLWSEDELNVLIDKLMIMDTVLVSSTKMIGFENLYATIQRVVGGGG